MQVIRGFVLNGKVVPAELEVRDGRSAAPALWWCRGETASFRVVCRRRNGAVKACVVHHQGGEGDAVQLHKVLCQRGLSVHFQVDRFGVVTQLADVADVCLHAGAANEATWGVEIANSGVAPGRGTSHPGEIRREPYLDKVHGRNLWFLAFFPEQKTAVEKLVREVNSALGLGLGIPRSADGRVARGIVKVDYSAHQVLAHYMLTEDKVDPAPDLMDYLAEKFLP